MNRHRPLSLAAAAAAAAALAGCGASSLSSSHSGNATGQLSPAQFLQAAVRYSRCMRSHGVPSLPQFGTPGWKATLGSTAPAVVGAERTCARVVPGVGPSAQSQTQTPTPQRIAALLAFAGCLRHHGFPSFPDPTRTGELTHAMVSAAGIDVQQPATLEAADACVGVTHGVITKEAVARFVAGQ